MVSPELSFLAVEQDLRDRFAPIVGNLLLSDLVGPPRAPSQETSVPPIPLEHYELWPVLGKPNQRYCTPSLVNSDGDNIPVGLSSWMEYPYQGKDGPLVVDARDSIALAYAPKGDAAKKRIIAHSSAGIVPDNLHLRIVQLQGAIRWGRSDARAHGEGLKGGFTWRDLLVNAWKAVAEELAAAHQIGAIELLPARQNRYYPQRITSKEKKKLARRLRAGYDSVARRMGFEGDANTMWVMPLDEPE